MGDMALESLEEAIKDRMKGACSQLLAVHFSAFKCVLWLGCPVTEMDGLVALDSSRLLRSDRHGCSQATCCIWGWYPLMLAQRLQRWAH